MPTPPTIRDDDPPITASKSFTLVIDPSPWRGSIRYRLFQVVSNDGQLSIVRSGHVATILDAVREATRECERRGGKAIIHLERAAIADNGVLSLASHVERAAD